MIRNASETWKIIFVVSAVFLVIIPCCLWGAVVSLCLTFVICALVSAYVSMGLLQRSNTVSSDVMLDLMKKIRLDGDARYDSKEDKMVGKSIGNQIYGTHCATDMNIDSCLHFIMRDFVNAWYQSISQNNQFSNETYYLMEDLSAALSSRLRKLNKYNTVKKFVRLYHSYFKNYLSAVQCVREKSQADNIFQCLHRTSDIEDNFTNWHYALADSNSEVVFMQSVVNILLEVLTPVELLTCTLSRKILAEILVRNVMIPLMDFLSNPDWLNKKLIVLLSDYVDLNTSSNNYRVNDDKLAENDDKFSSNVIEECISPVVENETCNERIEDENSSCDSNCIEFMNNESHAENGWKLAKRNSVVEGCSSTNRSDKSNSKFPTSKSLEHLSTLFLNKLSDMEKPIEFITDNIAQYFGISNEHDKQPKNNKTDTQDQHNRRGSIVSTNSDKVNMKPCTEDVISRPKSIPLALENVTLALTGPLLSGIDDVEIPTHFSENASKNCTQVNENVVQSNGKKQTSLLTNGMDEMNSRDNSRLKLNLRSPTAYFSSPKTPQTQMSDGSDGLLEAVEMSPDNRCFMNLYIPFTEIMEEANGGGQYALYCIEYEAWYLDHTPSHSTDSGSFVDVTEPRMVLQGSQVKRRFREFSTLHSRLEDNPRLRPHLHDVHKPNKWLSLPFSKTDRETIEDRRIFLEKYLRKLIVKEELAASTELREFLAYGSDASIAYVKKIPDSMVPRIDKFLARKVSGMLEKIRTALPTLPLETTTSSLDQTSNPRTSEKRGFLRFQFGTHDDTYPIVLQFGYAEKEAKGIDDYLRRFINDSHGEQSELFQIYDDIPTPLSPTTPSLPGFPGFEAMSNSETENCVQSPDLIDLLVKRQQTAIDSEIPITSSLINLSIDILYETDTVLKKENLVTTFKLLSGKLMESWLHDKIDEYTTHEMCIRYVGRIRDAIWPGGLLPMEPETERTETEKLNTKREAFHCLKKFLPSVLPLIVGSNQYDQCVQLFLDSLQHSKLLRHFFYNVLDLIVDALAPEMKSEGFHWRFTDVN